MLSVTSSSAADERAVALDAFALHVFAARVRGQALRHEAALGADRHDHRVLDVLRLHQAEHFGAEVLAPVGPADAAAGDVAHAQVHAFDARRVDEDLERRPRLRQLRHVARVELERQPALVRLLAVLLIIVRAQRRTDRADEAPQDAVLVEAGDRIEQAIDLGLHARQLGLAAAAPSSPDRTALRTTATVRSQSRRSTPAPAPCTTG